LFGGFLVDSISYTKQELKKVFKSFEKPKIALYGDMNDLIIF